ncbi:MAG: hypothetical protein OMM_11127 [Candidatus Magnetoglobus multicellularis str. Araruama]|uniref:Uncharacterized protein n=1 Tax=Candidatus Magnetoglobus multicellularis str. Araruama TaxID=890399 RepID=A0A1V1NZ85_9BACT|nr:MAG: hypothetical protein OMM_11127 [Candidatus Magnetoglobus multicellularis str. Araruama]
MDHPNKNQPKSDMMNKKLIHLIQANEDWLMEKILHYAIEREYSKYTSTLKEAWRLSISGLSRSFVSGLETGRTNFLNYIPMKITAKTPLQDLA